MIEQIILGAIQGLAEWLPISSEGFIVLAKTHLFHSQDPLNSIINQALLLHLGTLMATIVYFWKDIKHMFCAFKNWSTAQEQDKSLGIFLFLTTLISGVLGMFLIKKATMFIYRFQQAPMIITLLIALALAITGFLQLKAKDKGHRTQTDLTPKDGILLGIVQGCATLPGLSRSGTTISTLLLLNFDKTTALKLSFLMSVPIILIGNIILNFKALLTINTLWLGILTAFIVGLATIKGFLLLAQKVNFGLFLIGFSGLMVLSLFIGK